MKTPHEDDKEMRMQWGSGPDVRLLRAADTAEIADRAVWQVNKDRLAKMYCLAGIGGRVESIMVNAQAANSITAVDGSDPIARAEGSSKPASRVSPAFV